MPWRRDDGTFEIAIPVTPELWHDLHQQGVDPVQRLHEKGLDRCRMHYQMDEMEVSLVDSDPTYSEDCRTQYWETMNRFDKHRKLPRRIVLTAMRPGSRKANMKEDGSAKGDGDE